MSAAALDPQVIAIEPDKAIPVVVDPAPLDGQLDAYDLADPSVWLGESGVEGPLVNKQGLALKTYFWPATDPKAVLLFVHGHGNHTLFELLEVKEPGQVPTYRSTSWVGRFNAAGISVMALDNQGCGRSEGLFGLRFYADSFDDFVDDIRQLVDCYPEQYRELVSLGGKEGEEAREGSAGEPGAPVSPFSRSLPLFISGISMGGCIATNAVLRDPSPFAGAVLYAPMLSLERVSRKGLNPYLRPVASLLSRLAPTLPVVSASRGRDGFLTRAWDLDALTSKGKTRVRLATEFIRATEATTARLEEVSLPFLAFHSENDDQVDCEGTKALFLRASTEDKSLRLVNSMWHILVKEPGNEAIQEDTIHWMLRRI